jgi:hypothetical protein
MAENGTGRTDYMVLRQNADGHWLELASVPAHNAKAACVRAASEHIDPDELQQGVHFRAVSLRAWTTGAVNLTVKHETKVIES